jgi:hypothetical protein
VFRLLDPKAFAACFTRFMQRFAENLQGVVAIDGAKIASVNVVEIPRHPRRK